MTVGQLGGILGYILFIFSDGKTGVHYFKYYLPGLAIGSFSNNVAVTCVTSVLFPPAATRQF
jgi:hypothetical protein